jgi:hypothetical protein
MDKEKNDAKTASEEVCVKRFASKKNRVALMEFREGTYPDNTAVMKQYVHENRAVREASILQRLQGKAAVPRVFDCSDDTLVMEYIPGPTLADWLEAEEIRCHGTVPPTVEQMLCRLLQWLAQLYDVLAGDSDETMIMGDVNLRNFIVGDELTGVDFEDVTAGCIEEDLGKLAAFMLMYRPEKTRWKYNLVEMWLIRASEKFHIPVGKIQMEMDKEMKRMTLRRPSKKG